jgi:hypothetical protein
MHQFEDSKLPEVVEIPAGALAVWHFRNWSKGTWFALVPCYITFVHHQTNAKRLHSSWKVA